MTGSRLSQEKTPAPRNTSPASWKPSAPQAIALIKLFATVGRYSPGVVASSGCLPRHSPALCQAAYASWITTPTLNNPSASGRYHGTKPMATSSVVAGNRLTKLLITGCRISASTLCGNRTARVRNATPRRNQIATASATRISPGQRVTGQMVPA
ncbi:Uncharacterised protein [Enterobacter cloacae]|nr:Uncharacterised protein [Enterobacter cloacae]